MPTIKALPPKLIEEICNILSRGKGVEIAVRNGHLVVWETNSKKKYEVTVA